MPTTATVTGTLVPGNRLTCTLTGYASDILNFSWYHAANASGGGSALMVTNNASSATDDVDAWLIDPTFNRKYIFCRATLDSEGIVTSNVVGPILGRGGVRSGPRIIVRNLGNTKKKAKRGA